MFESLLSDVGDASFQVSPILLRLTYAEETSSRGGLENDWSNFLYATRAGFRSLSIWKSPYGIQKEEIVLANVYPIFVQLFLRLWSRISEMLKQVMDYLLPIIIYVHISFSFRNIFSTEVDWHFLLPATVPQLDTNLVEVPFWYVRIVVVPD